jgi:hypothetical protein
MVTTIAYTKHLLLLVNVFVGAGLCWSYAVDVFLWWYFCNVVYTAIGILFLYYDRFHMFVYRIHGCQFLWLVIALSVFSNIYFFFFLKKNVELKWFLIYVLPHIILKIIDYFEHCSCLTKINWLQCFWFRQISL